MMNALTLILVAILMVFFERLISSLLALQIGIPHIVPTLLLYYGTTRTFKLSIAVAIFAGWLVDGISNLPWGTSSISLILIAIIVRIYRDISFERFWSERFLLGALCGAMFVLFQYLLVRHNTELPVQLPFSMLIMKMFISAISCGIFSPFVCKTMGFIENLLGNIVIKEEINDETTTK